MAEGDAAKARPRPWFLRLSLGIAVLLPAALVVALLPLTDRLLPTPLWLVALGLPAAPLLVLTATLLTTRKGPAFALRVWPVALAAPLRRPPPPLRWAHLLLAATGEELLFRVLGLHLLGPGPLGVAVTCLAFALPHLLAARPGRRAAAFVDAFTAGAAFAALYLVGGGVAPAVLAHFLRNVHLEALRGLVAQRAHRDPAARSSQSS